MITSQGNNVSKSLVYWRHIWQSTWKQNLATRKRIVFFRAKERQRERERGRNGEETDKQAGKEKEREENAQCDRKRSDYKKQS